MTGKDSIRAGRGAARAPGALALLRLDLITVKPYLTIKNLLLFMAVAAFVTVGTGTPSTAIGLLVMYGTLYTSYPFALGERNGLDMLYATLPLGRGSVVTGRYLFSLCMDLLAGMFALILSAVTALAAQRPAALAEGMVTVAVCVFLFSILKAVQLPIFFKLGYNKAKLFTYLPLVIFAGAVTAAASLMGKEKTVSGVTGLFVWVQAHAALTAVALILLWAGIMLLSMRISRGIYEKKEV